MDYIMPEVLITPATLQIQSPEKQKNLLCGGSVGVVWEKGGKILHI
jgi:hypothetical protein